MRKVILVTGAATGLGEALATYLFEKGHTVYGVSRNIQAAGRPFHVLKMDVCDENSIKQAIQAIIEQQGRIDVLINNAGLGLVGPAEHLSIDHVTKVLDTNVLGVLRTCQAVLPYMRKRRSGLLINISSIAATNGLPYRAAYCASKAALDRLTEALRIELAPFGIQACYVQPGGFNTTINDNRITTTLPAGSEYGESWERCHQVIMESVSQGLSPDRLGPLVEKIMHSERVKRCYRIGRPLEKLSVILKRILPDQTYDSMIRKHFKI